MAGSLKYCPELRSMTVGIGEKSKNFLFQLLYVSVSFSWKTQWVGCVAWFFLIHGCRTGNSHSETIISAGVLVMAKYMLAALEMSCP